MTTALLTNYLPAYRVPLYERLAKRHDLEVLCYGGGERYVPPWFADLDQQISRAPFPARRLGGARAAFNVAAHYETLIAPFAGGAMLPAAYAGARIRGRRFVLWASVWAQPHSLTHALALPITRDIYRNADAVIAYGEHVRSFVAAIRGRDDDVFVAPQSVEAELFGRQVSGSEVQAFRARHKLGDGPLVLYVGRLVPEKGIEVLREAFARVRAPATLVLIGEGPDALGPLPREELPVAYAAADLAVLASIATPRFREPWGLVCNEAMHQGTPVLASDAVGAVAGGLVRDGETGLVVKAGDVEALRAAIERLLSDESLRHRLGTAGQRAVAAYTYDAMVEAFDRALGAEGAP